MKLKYVNILSCSLLVCLCMNRFTKQRMKAAKQKCRKTCLSGLFKQSAAAASTIQQSIKGQIQIGLINASGNRQFSVVSNVAADFSAERNALRVGQWPTQEWQSSPLPGCTCKSIKEWRILTGLLSSNYTCISDVHCDRDHFLKGLVDLNNIILT